MFAGDDVYRPPPHRCRSASAAAAFDLSLCTEAVGCESCEMVLDDAEMAAAEGVADATATRSRSRSRSRRCRGEQASFPPPMPLRNSFLRAERMEGRIVLTEIRIERPEIFRAFRDGGRLRLQLIRPEEEAQPPEAAAAEEEATPPEAAAAEEEMAAAAAAAMQEDVEIGRERRREGFRRCHPAVGGNRAPLGWAHRFVTTA